MGIAAFFAVAFLVLAALGRFLAGHLSPDRAWRGGEFPCSEPDPILDEIDSDHFGLYDRLYYGIGPAIGNARRADILLLGNSRVLFAFRAPEVRAFEAKTGLKVFNLCFPANDGMAMAWETIQRNNLRPALVVVNENQFFEPGVSRYGLETIQEGKWGAWSRVWQQGLSWEVRCVLHRFFPRFGFGSRYPAVPMVTLQSQKDGCLLFEDFSRDRASFPVLKVGVSDHPTSERIRFAREFQAFLASRGTRLVFTNIPYDMDSYVMALGDLTAREALLLAPVNLKPFHKAVKLAKDLQVPLLVPPLGGMRTLDGSHLDPPSADRFAQGFFSLLERYLAGKPLSAIAGAGKGKP